jgi:hypothetical protein
MWIPSSSSAALAVALLACGGGKAAPVPENPGTSHVTSDEPGDAPPTDAAAGGETPTTPETPAEPAEPVPPASPFTFVLSNTAEEDLVFSMDKGWQPVLFAYSGKPPKAVPILMFSKWCTETCEADDEARCPSCPQPEKPRDIAAAEKREVAAAGSEVRVPWDGQVFVYEKTRASGKRCECWKRAEPPAGEYTVKACGFRVSREPSKPSKMQCAETTMTLPPAATPVTVSLEFPAVPAAPAKK